jgi:predicted metal-dependent peptidase
MTTTLSLPELDYRKLDREFDRAKSQVFLARKANFLGPLMCSLDFSWNTNIETACTNGLVLWFNPHFFLGLPIKTRPTIIKHELWHPALMHMIRRGSRDPKIWNYAADIVINNMLDDDGDSFEGVTPWLDHAYDGWTTEDVYDDLIKKCAGVGFKLPAPFMVNPLTGGSDPSDLVEPTSSTEKTIEHMIVNNVVSANHSSALSGGCGKMPGEIETTLKRFLAPKLPWERILFNFFNALGHQDYSWARPNRRYRDMYLPSLQDDTGGLEHLAYFEDVSGSITEADSIRFNSEFKYVKERFEPEKMTLIQFDTEIQKEEVFLRDDPFDEVRIVGGGGTCLICVRDWIIKNRPTAVVIFSDMIVTPMEPLPRNLNVPIIWVALNNRGAKVFTGQLVHLNE